jgi:hypothetical protein
LPQNTFDERIAATSETRWPELFDPVVIEPAVDFLAGMGTALELGVGTGRLREQPGAEQVEVTIGDFATTRVGTFDLAYLVRNTITNLTTQDEQVACSAP